MTPLHLARQYQLADLPVNFWLVGQEGHDRQRGERYSLASIRGHPGKMLPALATRLVEHYTKPGDWILDPFSGIGTTGVESIHRDRHYVGLELEAPFVRWQRENLEAAQAKGASGQFRVFQHDARQGLPALLDQPPAFIKSFAAVLTSPPYGKRLKFERNPGSPLFRELIRKGTISGRSIPGSYGASPQNLGNLGSETYLAAVKAVYQHCFAVLRPGGILAIVLQPERDGTVLRPLHHETARICREIGFTFLDEIIAIYSRLTAPGKAAEAGDPESLKVISHASFWRRLAVARQRQAGNPITLGQLEYVLVFRKPSSPPSNPSLSPRRHPSLSRRASSPAVAIDKNRLSAALASPLGPGA